jgi:hypothetical protein
MKTFLFCCALLIGPIDSKDNLVENPGFEKTKDKEPESWTMAGPSEGGKCEMSISKTEPKSGDFCLSLVGNAEWGCVVSNHIPVETYVLTGFARSKKGAGYIKFDYFKDGEFIGMTAPDSRAESKWKEIKVESEISSYPTATHLTATLVGADGEFEIDFDDIQIVKK